MDDISLLFPINGLTSIIKAFYLILRRRTQYFETEENCVGLYV